MLTEISAEMLTQVVQSVFISMMDLEALPVGSSWLPSEHRVRFSVQITGGWHGTLLFECSRQEAYKFAARFLSINLPEVTDDAVNDVVSEIANMIGGNVKCAMGTGLSLSLPSIMEDGCDPSAGNVDCVSRLAFQCLEGRFCVTLFTAPGKMFVGSTSHS